MKTKTPTTTTALALPTVQSIQPKPTKTEIVEAMLARAKVKHDAENERRSKRAEVLQKKIEAIAIKAIKSRTPSVSIYTYDNSESSHCDVQFQNLKTPELEPLFKEMRGLRRLCWDEKAIRDAIRRELTGIQRPNQTRLLDNPDTVKAIDAMLTQWGL